MPPFVLLCAKLIQKREIDDLFGVNRLQLLVHGSLHPVLICARLWSNPKLVNSVRWVERWSASQKLQRVERITGSTRSRIFAKNTLGVFSFPRFQSRPETHKAMSCRPTRQAPSVSRGFPAHALFLAQSSLRKFLTALRLMCKC